MTRKEWDRPDTQRAYLALWRRHLAAEVRSMQTRYGAYGNVTLIVDGSEVNTPAELRRALKKGAGY
jgi:hypothetical protein